MKHVTPFLQSLQLYRFTAESLLLRLHFNLISDRDIKSLDMLPTMDTQQIICDLIHHLQSGTEKEANEMIVCSHCV